MSVSGERRQKEMLARRLTLPYGPEIARSVTLHCVAHRALRGGTEGRMSLRLCVSRFVRQRDGTDLIECALLGAAVAIFCWVGVTRVGDALGDSYMAVVTTVTN